MQTVKKTQIVFLIDYLKHKGGAEKNLFDIVTGLDKEKFECIVMSMQSGDMLDQVRESGIEAYDLNIKRIYSPIAIFKEIKLYFFLRKRKINILVTYHESSDFIGALVGKMAGVKLISSRRDMGFRLNKRHISIYKHINKLFDKIITVSDAVKQIIYERENVPLEKMITIYNGVDIERFQIDVDINKYKQELGIPLDSKVIGTVGNIRHIKGTDIFIGSIPGIVKKFDNVYFLIVGKYEQADIYYQQLKQQIEKNNISDRVIFTGKRIDIPELLQIMDVVVFPSRSEGFSNAIIEAMAAGKPVIATDVGGNKEVINSGKDGIITPDCNLTMIESAIKLLLSDEDMNKHIRENVKNKIINYFSLKKMNKNVEKLYAEI